MSSIKIKGIGKGYLKTMGVSLQKKKLLHPSFIYIIRFFSINSYLNP
jgi:hypothetical protein